jgi:Protein of unknown function (DUF1553)/Protein of unknown function (DUF1549)
MPSRCLRPSLWLGLLLVFGIGLVSSIARAEEVVNLARFDAQITSKEREHWSFQPVRRPAIPSVKDPAWVRNPIDAFVLAKLEAKGWKPSPAAEPGALLRRIHLDLTGLPPTLAEQDAFRADPSPAVLDRVVDNLLQRPAHGERWARHWLDVARYADTNGYERDGNKPSVWRYRDYVIRAFNDDKPFDRFLLEQIAGDELPDSSPDTILATGFHRLGPWDDEPADPKADHYDQLDDMVATTAQVFLGLTLQCARCHNHKFEPLTMLDYYRMVAVFHGLKRPGNGRSELDLPALPPARRSAEARVERQIRGLLAGRCGTLLASAGMPFIALGPSAAGEYQIQKARSDPAPRGYFLHETSPFPPATPLLVRGAATRPGPEVAPGMPAVLVEKQPAFLPPSEHTSRRRLTLARWMASPDHPLTARVIVNRVWGWHFGAGLVRTPSDFGVMGQPPTHPELLDYLADRFVREGWSIKKLHRLILTSNTYRMSKRSRPECMVKDPENRLLWRAPYRRLEVEAVRDSMLAISGQLNPQLYGPSMFPSIPREAVEGHSDPNTVWMASSERDQARRTIYVHVKRSLLVPLLETLDFCDTARTAAQRSVTTVAPQALTLFNGAFVNQQSRHLADRLFKEVGPDSSAQIERIYRLALCRPPTERERMALLGFLQARERDGMKATEAAVQMCRVVLNLNEFVYPD